jgi:hypothetical protein
MTARTDAMDHLVARLEDDTSLGAHVARTLESALRQELAEAGSGGPLWLHLADLLDDHDGYADAAVLARSLAGTAIEEANR